MTTDLAHVEHVRLIRVRTGDVIVASVDKATPHAAVPALKARLNELFPDNEVCVCLGVDLSIARMADAA